ncbi:cell wall-binding repeat-containing protein [Metabacillus herbersteinensis]|uniref:Cell wall-binding repeat-containing protein n=1 Tax=Metabacillus herbersteinensis TaxID=283816 RepID=A0ABV6GPM2_9BACI
MRKINVLTILIVILSLNSACTNLTKDNTQEEQEEKVEEFSTEPTDFNPHATEGLLTRNTKNVTRLNSSDKTEFAVLVSQTVWAATHKENQPRTVILTVVEDWQISMASAKLIQHPNNGPILFIEKDHIPDLTLKEIKRLNPIGNADGTQVMIMGDVSASIYTELEDYQVEGINSSNPAEFALLVDDKYAESSNGVYPNNVIIVSQEEEAKLYSLPAINWISNMPEPILFVSKDNIPLETKTALENRNSKANIYILGPENIIPTDVEEQLKEYGSVKRISGSDPISNSISFAKYKDEKIMVGWGAANPGLDLSFVSTKTPELAKGAASLGKQTPMIFLEDGELNEDIYTFLAEVKPVYTKETTDIASNHAFINGTDEVIPFKSQGIIDEKLAIVFDNEQQEIISAEEKDDGHGH